MHINCLTTVSYTHLDVYKRQHGNDPTFKGTDHTREQVPLIIYSKELIKPKQLPEMDSFAVIGATIADNFEVELPEIGNSILDKII